MDGNKNRGLKIGVIAALVISVVAIGIGFATFTETLRIEGSATVQTSTWKVKFTNLSAPTLLGTATVVTPPTINTNDTTISTYDVKLSKPGDSVSYTFDVANTGTYNAKLTSINSPTPTCNGKEGAESATTDAANVCKHLTYTLTYADGTPLAQDDALAATSGVANMKLTLTYESHDVAADLPKQDVTISNLGISLVYSQAD